MSCTLFFILTLTSVKQVFLVHHLPAEGAGGRLDSVHHLLYAEPAEDMLTLGNDWAYQLLQADAVIITHA